MQHSTVREGDRYAAFEHPAHLDDEAPRPLNPDQRRRAAAIRRAEARRRRDRIGLGLGPGGA
ncbi:hypothetical protein [Streptomyces californicus]|uniref:hypothetical protein n=1 Tax=Streptomyces californicus TaxID=67351 RepID=UPI00296FF099|nr:hypothetical protein [Streptomyces californicus]MDW4912526.1 hypothetical protein [Streptomyces californicus]